MPTYEYVCEKCGQNFDVFQSMTDAALTVCPKERCAKKRWGKGKVRRTIGGGAGLIFKGSGFYITDYRSEGYKAAAKKEGTPASSPSPGSGGGGEAKSSAPASGSASGSATATSSKPKPSST